MGNGDIINFVPKPGHKTHKFPGPHFTRCETSCSPRLDDCVVENGGFQLNRFSPPLSPGECLGVLTSLTRPYCFARTTQIVGDACGAYALRSLSILKNTPNVRECSFASHIVNTYT